MPVSLVVCSLLTRETRTFVGGGGMEVEINGRRMGRGYHLFSPHPATTAIVVESLSQCRFDSSYFLL